MVRRHLEVREPTVLGHMNACRLGTQSTKKNEKEKDGGEKMKCILDEDNNSLKKPIPSILQSRERQVCVHLVSFDKLKGYISTDLCGVYPTMSNRGMKYVLVLYDYDSNAITARVMKTNKREAIKKTYDAIYTELKEAGIIPILQYLDNETSKELIASIKRKNLKYQLAAPHDHRLNPAERVASTFKNHFIAILAGCDERFPKYLWCQLIPQAVITLNMLQQSRINPKLLAHDQVFGTFNYQRTPLAPRNKSNHPQTP